MTTVDNSEETRLLRDLLAEAHGRVRELQFQVDQLAAELIALRLSDRRSASRSRTEDERERSHSEVTRAIEPRADRRGQGKHSAPV